MLAIKWTLISFNRATGVRLTPARFERICTIRPVFVPVSFESSPFLNRFLSICLSILYNSISLNARMGFLLLDQKC